MANSVIVRLRFIGPVNNINLCRGVSLRKEERKAKERTRLVNYTNPECISSKTTEELSTTQTLRRYTTHRCREMIVKERLNKYIVKRYFGESEK